MQRNNYDNDRNFQRNSNNGHRGGFNNKRDFEQRGNSDRGRGGGMRGGRGGFGGPRPMPYQPKVELLSNFFSFNLENKQFFYQYSLTFTPDVPDDSSKRRDIYFALRKEIVGKVGSTLFNKTLLWAERSVNEVLTFKTQIGDQEYTLAIQVTNEVDLKSYSGSILVKRLLGEIITKTGFKKIRRNFFNSKESINMAPFQLWPGVSPKVSFSNNSLLLNVDVVYKLIRGDSALDFLNRLRDNSENFNQSVAREAVINQTVVTSYNSDKTYCVTDIDFDLTPKSTFNRNGKETSYAQYYQECYGNTISALDQPLLVARGRRGDTIHLIPELCKLTGITDEIREDSNLMKGILDTTKKSADEKMRQVTEFIKTIRSSEAFSKLSEEWKINLEEKPVKFTTARLAAGNILMGSSSTFSVESSTNFDRDIQKPMFNQPNISNWVIFYGQRDARALGLFKDTFMQVIDTFKYSVAEPRVIEVGSQNPRDWLEFIKRDVVPETQLVLVIAPGQKGNSPVYKDIKQFLSVEMAIPCQFICGGTIMKPKGLRSVLNKLLMQICAKVGGQCWAVEGMPFSEKPTAVVGVTQYATKIKGVTCFVVGLTFSTNDSFTAFASFCEILDKKDKIGEAVILMMEKGLKAFENKVGIQPQKVIVMRDALSAQTVLEYKKTELISIVNFVSERVKGAELLCVGISKNSSNKFFSLQGETVVNPPSGTLISDSVTDEKKSEFFLISQFQRQGAATPVHYELLYPEKADCMDQLATLCYKLCYTYYNWSGSIKIPAPVHYAMKLCYLVGDKLCDKGKCVPRDEFSNSCSYFYI